MQSRLWATRGREANGVCPGHCAQWALKDKNVSSQHCVVVTPTPSSRPDLGRYAWSKWYRERCFCLGAGGAEDHLWSRMLLAGW